MEFVYFVRYLFSHPVNCYNSIEIEQIKQLILQSTTRFLRSIETHVSPITRIQRICSVTLIETPISITIRPALRIGLVWGSRITKMRWT